MYDRFFPACGHSYLGVDDRFCSLPSGIVKDSNTGLEWKVGPDKDTNWNEVRSWVQSLSLDDGGWRMPTVDELVSLYVCLTIEDDGEGMDEETKDGIFEPFFTTKFQGRGMGMAAVYGIIKSHDGWIYVDSELGKGTVVRIYFPAVEAKEEIKKEAVLRPTVEWAMGEGTILVIEDEEPLVGLFREILEILGYRALLARTGKEAVELAKTFDGQIDLALLDIKLPDMDGGRVYPLIMEARPDMKVIVCSGYSIYGPAQDILDAGAEGFIQKPFSIAPFAEKLKDVLEGK